MAAERGLELLAPARASEERETAGPVEKRLLSRSRGRCGSGAAAETRSEGEAAQRAREQGFSRLDEEVRPPGAIDEGVARDPAVRPELGLEGAPGSGGMVEELEGLLAGLHEAQRLPQENAVRRRMRDGDDEDLERAAANLGINLSRNESASVEDLA